MHNWPETQKEPQENESDVKSIAPSLFGLFVGAIGLISTVYLVANALYLLFLAAVFGQYSPHTPMLEYLAYVAMNAVPAFCFAAIGVTGLFLWRSKRFWVFGLSAVLVETILALCVLVRPESMLIFSDLL